MRRDVTAGTIGIALLLACGIAAGAAGPAGLDGDNPVADSNTSADPALVQAAAGCDPIDPSLCLLPWPNDFFTAADSATDTGRRLAVSPLATPRNVAGKPVDPTDWNRNDGFSPGSPIVVHVPGLDTPAAFDITNPVPVNDIGRYTEPDAPVVVLDATTGRRHPVWVELDRSPTIDSSTVDPTGEVDGPPPAPERTALLIRPAINFREGHRYIVALRNLRDAQGAAIHANPAFQALIDGDGAAPRQSHYDDDIFPVLAQAGIAREGLVLAWDFTVASARNLSERVLFMRDDAFAKLGDTDLSDGVVQGSSPTFVVDKVSAMLPCRPESGTPPACEDQISDPRVLRHIEGRIFVPCYLNEPGCPTGSQFLYATPQDTIPTPIPGNTIAANFQCNIPAGAADGRTFRPSLNGHGLFGSADGVNSDKFLELAKSGLMLCATDEIGMASEDIPNALAVLADLSRFSSIPDRLQQGMLDMLYTFDFGDGSPAITREAPTIAHAYDRTGSFRASVTVTDARGTESGNNAQVIVQATPAPAHP